MYFTKLQTAIKQEGANENTCGDRLTELAQISTELARVVAKNPCATSEVLRILSSSDDTETRQNVAGNPNTPTQVLWQLGAKFRQALLDNPIFSLLFVEKPNLVAFSNAPP
ncbi:hypothetical protein [Microseira wollei]|uniref:Uncharacterized protein n=1 Tax=Microseira wollei NIES-4236 TaxID=2530354 RepID=A0AAV3XN74_9CYAN|nr:hypothetical protein [Microseira wollei]GET41022.1 hypothetical protein MiSe_58340 [Microseira wollei NIES-4236]